MIVLMAWDAPNAITGPKELTIEIIYVTNLNDLIQCEAISNQGYIDHTREVLTIERIVYQNEFMLIEELNNFEYPTYKIL